LKTQLQYIQNDWLCRVTHILRQTLSALRIPTTHLEFRDALPVAAVETLPCLAGAILSPKYATACTSLYVGHQNE
jgi:hypothetical protein